MSNPIATHPREPADTPFGPRTAGRRRLLIALGAGGGLAAIIVAVYLLSGGATREGAPTGGHNHGAAPMADSAMPVSLSDNDRRRIGVTFTAVERSPLSRQVRTVEQLYVNATGQAVKQGQPLFAIYSPMLVTTQQEMLLARRLTEQVAGGTQD